MNFITAVIVALCGLFIIFVVIPRWPDLQEEWDEETRDVPDKYEPPTRPEPVVVTIKPWRGEVGKLVASREYPAMVRAGEKGLN